MEHEQLHKIKPYLGQFREKGSEIQALYCPFCNGGRHKDKYTFGINKLTGAYNCLRGSCGEVGNLHTLGKYLGVDIVESKETYFREYRKPKKIYKKPEVKAKDISKQNIEYFQTRLISVETLIKNKITTDKNNNIMFNYYLDGEIIFIKYKIPRKPNINKDGKKERKTWREADTRPILYGMDDCDPSKPLVIIEGEPDKLVLDECGVENAVSIPSGTEDFTWLDECWDWMEQFDELIIWGDNDAAGKGFQQEAIARLDDWKLKIVKCEYKDANVLLYEVAKRKGIEEAKEEVRNHIKNATPIKKDYITNLANVKRKDYRQIKAITTGYQELDSLIGGMYGGQLVIWTGYNGSGKSTILSNIILNGIEAGHRTFVYSGELPKEDFKEWMDLQLSGSKYLTSYDCPVKKQNIPIPDSKYYNYLDAFYQDMIYLFDTEDYATDNNIISAMEYMAKREGINVFVVDNMLTMNITGQGDNNEKQAKLIIKLKAFARRFNAVVHLVAHPRKPALGQKRVDKYSVSGTANITDLADRVIGFHRLTAEEKQTPEYMGYNNVMIIFKDRKYGIFDQEILFKFDFFSKRYYTNDLERNKKYSWVKQMSKDEGIPEGFQITTSEDCPF
ncbi:DnaB-like helicase C-terminal domain-containing protein [Gudongella sp. SC589]|uniref:DnaB-like helicase C-terminal domain-containing protein n=1 Tax=Gudongella sp. SC589 TaxID=3385990 RepID=UPI003904DA06